MDVHGLVNARLEDHADVGGYDQDTLRGDDLLIQIRRQRYGRSIYLLTPISGRAVALLTPSRRRDRVLRVIRLVIPIIGLAFLPRPATWTPLLG